MRNSLEETPDALGDVSSRRPSFGGKALLPFNGEIVEIDANQADGPAVVRLAATSRLTTKLNDRGAASPSRIQPASIGQPVSEDASKSSVAKSMSQPLNLKAWRLHWRRWT
jgi:hypothetical protein